MKFSNQAHRIRLVPDSHHRDTAGKKTRVFESFESWRYDVEMIE